MKKIIVFLLKHVKLPHSAYSNKAHDNHHKTKLHQINKTIQTNARAFSLIELLISLITISLIISAFAPVLSTKLKQSAIVYSGAKEMKIDCSVFDKPDGNCLLCTKTQCSLCSSSINTPDGYYVNPNESCSKQACTKFSAECKRCNKDGCQECKNGYQLSADKKCTQVRCPKGYYVSGSSCQACANGQYQPNDNSTAESCISCTSSHAKCTACNLQTGCCSACSGEWIPTSCSCGAPSCGGGKYWNGNNCVNCSSHCTNCTNINSCTACEAGWHISANTCVQDIQELKPNEINCAKINAVFIPAKYNGVSGKDLCVSKYNAGDINGPILTGEVNLRPSTDTTNCQNGKCCWTGGTINYTETSTPSNFDYNTANRTLCNSNAANVICNNYVFKNGNIEATGWRLPTYNELVGWHANLEAVSRDNGKNGLQLCDRGGGSRAGGGCNYGSSCPHTYFASTEPYVLFGQNSYMYLWEGQKSGVWSGQYTTYACGSVRCVIEKFKGM